MNNYKKFFISFIFIFSFLSFSSISSYAADFSAYNGYNIYFSTYDLANSTVGRIFRSTDSHSFYSATTQYINGVHHFQNTAVEGANAVGIETSYRSSGSANGEFFFPVNNDVYNYYIVGVMNSYYSPTFKPDWLQINLGKPDGTFIYSQYSVASGKLDLITNAVTTSQVGYSFSAKVDFTEYTGIRGIYLISQSSTIPTSSIGDNVNFMASIVEIPKSASQEQVNSIIAAIQNQTNVLSNAISNNTTVIGDKIDDTNDYIDGNTDTDSIVGGFDDSEDNFNDVISDYHTVEQTFFDDFRANQTAISNDITGWSWGGLVNCADWVGDTVTDYYNNMGDFRQFIIYPLMLGIALFFLGRGSSIIGHLYRKPTENTSYTISRSFDAADGRRYTSSTVYRSGGTRRK